MTVQWVHYKDGATYKVITDQALLENTKERAVVYQSELTGQIWVRSFADFHAMVEDSNGKFVRRFWPLNDKEYPDEKATTP